jgi:hypothetical protein
VGAWARDKTYTRRACTSGCRQSDAVAVGDSDAPDALDCNERDDCLARLLIGARLQSHDPVASAAERLLDPPSQGTSVH